MCPALQASTTSSRHLAWAGEREAIVPGVSYVGEGRADVMRGEEVQLLGGVAAGMVDPEGFVCHPGTHNKWVSLRHGAIQIFGTVMTGELFNLLKEHSILADLLQGPVEVNDAFKRGVRHAMEREMLPADLFGVRAAVLLGQAKKEDAASYASGLLIGTDVRIGLTWPAGARSASSGRPELTRLYAAAIAEAEREAIEIDGEQCFLAGIHEIAKRIDSEPPGTCFDRYLDAMPAGRDHPRRHARRGGGDRRGDFRRRHPDHRGAIELARPAGKHRAAGGADSATARWSARGTVLEPEQGRGGRRRRAAGSSSPPTPMSR